MAWIGWILLICKVAETSNLATAACLSTDIVVIVTTENCTEARVCCARVVIIATRPSSGALGRQAALTEVAGSEFKILATDRTNLALIAARIASEGHRTSNNRIATIDDTTCIGLLSLFNTRFFSVEGIRRKGLFISLLLAAVVLARCNAYSVLKECIDESSVGDFEDVEGSGHQIAVEIEDLSF